MLCALGWQQKELKKERRKEGGRGGGREGGREGKEGALWMKAAGRPAAGLTTQ